MDGDAFADTLKRNIECSKSKPSDKSFWPSPVWISNFMKRFNLKKIQDGVPCTQRWGYCVSSYPSLEMTYVLRELFNIPGGLGRILNIDESMTYRYDQEEKSWTY